MRAEDDVLEDAMRFLSDEIRRKILEAGEEWKRSDVRILVVDVVGEKKSAGD